MNALRTTLPRLAASTPSVRAFSTTTPRALAKMTVVGRLADTPELQATSTGRDIIRYAIGVSTGPKDENGNRQTSWFRLASFAEGGQRDYLLSLPKGSLMYVEADAKMDSFQTAEGQSRSTLSLLARKCSHTNLHIVDSSTGSDCLDRQL
ncbi:nucleic acid-binding protein [Polychaeton citri CBS 116435]|uniref:Nucleic acid-binding protein n=1 Tax=Polychaeton citri CBS 116435 TaxID=1314669 RepID=A0A9P4Q8Y7_9PEZI|nr:nucleic acid-binding protein [Polychaeton citri CBS 116435]